MKKILFFAFGLGVLLTSCEEIAPTVTPLTGPPVDTIPDVGDQLRQVLIEEFTGVRCVQCPGGSAEVENLLAIHGPQLIAVQIHAGDFAPPFTNESTFDFRTQEGDEIINYLGKPLTYPSAVVNRRLFDDELDLQLGKNSWAGYIDIEKAETPKVKIALELEHDEAANRINADVTLFVEEQVMDPDIRLSLMLTESGIVDLQDTPDGKNFDYVHKHVLREMLTPFNGDIVPSPLIPGTTSQYNYSIEVSPDWDVEKCTIIAFVSLEGPNLDVLQAIERSVIE